MTTGRIETYQIATYSLRTLLKMDYWSPKHVELLNVMNKINHQILCILLDYIYIGKWYTVHTLSKQYHIASKFTENHHHRGHHYQPEGRSHPGLLYLHECCFLQLFLLRPTFFLQADMYIYRKYCGFKVFEKDGTKWSLVSSRTYKMLATIEFRSLDLSNPYLKISKF